MNNKQKVILAVPSLDEEAVLENTVLKTLEFIESDLKSEFDIRTQIVDNGSKDKTPEIGRRLEAEHPGSVGYSQLGIRGKGLAIRHGWNEFEADIYAFMDADLATDLEALTALLKTCRDSDGLAIGSRHIAGSQVERSLLRRLLSWGYRLLLKTVLGTKISDLPCGFKAASKRVKDQILPEVRDNAWFFDTEFTIRTEKAGLPVTEIPVLWHEASNEERQSKVPLMQVAIDYLRQSWRLRRELRARKSAAGNE